MDGQISEVEFCLIVNEANKYHQMKAEICAGEPAHAAFALNEETKNSFRKAGMRPKSASLKNCHSDM